jgi:hypothetical protein
VEYAQKMLALSAMKTCDDGNHVVLLFGPYHFEVSAIEMPREEGGELLVCRCVDGADLVIPADQVIAFRVIEVS